MIATCPNNNDGRHQYFVSKTFEMYEPYQFTFTDEIPEDVSDLLENLPILYQKFEYAVLSCKCSDTLRKRIELRG